jgi:hypothetical protein
MGYGRKAKTGTEKSECYKTLNRTSDRPMNLRVPEKAGNVLCSRANKASGQVISVYSGCIENNWKNLRLELPTQNKGKSLYQYMLTNGFSSTFQQHADRSP